MGLRDEAEDELFKKHSELCNKLNLEPHTITDSWDSYQSINKNYILEGDKLQWLGLAVFVTCRSTEIPTVNQVTVKGNCVNLTTLLRHSNLSFAKFFSNINKWADMAKLSDEFREKIKHLKDTFGVTCNSFKEYYPLFERIFNVPDAQEFEQSKQHRPRKQRPIICNSSKVFEFVWMLFIILKGEHSQYGTELIKAYHLLYACLDLAFKNALLADRRDLLNPKFEALPTDFSTSTYDVPKEAPCTMPLISKCESMLTETLHLKTYSFKDMIVNLINTNILTADKDSLTGLFDENSFEPNFKNILKMYEARLLQKGDFDERVFVTEYKRILLEREQAQLNVQAPHFSEPGDGSLDSPRHTTPGTPLTARQYLGPREVDSSPFSADRTATELINRLHIMIQNRNAEPSEKLLMLFKSCSNDPTEKIANIITEMSEKVLNVSQELTVKQADAEQRVQIAVTLFYKFIETILESEKKIGADISNLVQKDLFFECMFGCCLEIVLFSYGSSKRFPWILDILKIEAHQFVKVIELIIRSKENLYKHLIKNLNRIEETIIESLVWKSTSKLWEEIEKSGQEIPKFEDTALPGHLLYAATNNKETPASKTNAEQPPGPSATDRFISPVNATTVNRQLFKTVTGGQSVLQKPAGNGTPKRTGSLSIIFRKFYNLAGVRMEHLCTKLDVSDMELKRKIWTVFEDSIRYTELVKDRHLDQLLMCAVYVICKICNVQLTFENIMKYYREQPQATSSIYRSVLLQRKSTEERDGETVEVPEKRGDLILFYNNVYVTIMKVHVLKYQSKQTTNENFLSPLPAGKYHLTSPSVQIVDNVFIKPFGSANSTPTGTGYNYIFSRSPSKDLKNINKAINNVIGKRLQTDADLDIPNSKRIANRKIQTLVEERRSQS